ncbi:CRISPR-associated endoribonuclease Cas6 [Texcoconibacillus texcoconensis]|uniref:CRISPR-associated endoribonuclease n=1 Tax=Texcoconibacillus texcoconensis TaxID=1095777 RepID=A0A840QSS9_9BACI|nr:CRISPR-associated endoribonuclease Cas6 [Texcoconibacillus texcoconensis]MBB5174425.1 CRISPR-associated endoribonuclease Cas6 [Texcoconibacillus texcoconensis]
MKLYLSFNCNELRLPVYYHRDVQGLIYNMLSESLGEFFHNRGYVNGSRTYKLFSFSRLEGDATFHKKEKTLTFHNEISLIISSIVPEFINELANNIILSQNLTIRNQHIEVSNVKMVHEPINSSKILVKTRSPITVYTTYERRNGKSFTHYFQPQDEAFKHLIEDGIFRKYEAFTNQEVPQHERFHIQPINVSKRDKIITKYKSTIINAWNGTYEIEAKPTYLEFALSASLGSKTSQGFGLITLVP